MRGTGALSGPSGRRRGKKYFVVPRCFPGGWVSVFDFFAKKLEKSLDWDKKMAYLCTRFRAGNGPWAWRERTRGRARFFDTDETRKDKQRRASGMFFLRDARKPWRGQ